MKRFLRPTGYGRNVLLLFVVIFPAVQLSAYSVFTHEELIDLAWNSSIRPVLLARFPSATEEQLIEAHAYAYGGCAIQDMGYYPFGKKFFSNLTHYVRTGDLLEWMFRNARTIDELAFAIGALSHYLGDSIGHAEAINPSTGVEFPKLRQKFGPSVTYGENPHAHIRTEFAFDIKELSDADFAPPAYMQFIGFLVPRRFLERAFIATYGFDIHDVLGRSHPALRSYRTSVRTFIPFFAEAEVVLHRHHFAPHTQDEAYRTFSERVARTNYERHWRRTRRGTGFKAHFGAILVFLVPKIGAASDLAIKIPTPETQERYLRSVNHTVDVFRGNLQKLAAGPADPGSFANLDLDTGSPARLGDYALADETYAKLLERITSRRSRVISEGLKRNLIEYYEGSADSGDPAKQIQQRLATLKTMATR